MKQGWIWKAKWNKLETKGYNLYDSIYTAFGKPELEGKKTRLVVAKGCGSEEAIDYKESTGNFLGV